MRSPPQQTNRSRIVATYQFGETHRATARGPQGAKAIGASVSVVPKKRNEGMGFLENHSKPKSRKALFFSFTSQAGGGARKIIPHRPPHCQEEFYENLHKNFIPVLCILSIVFCVIVCYNLITVKERWYCLCSRFQFLVLTSLTLSQLVAGRWYGVVIASLMPRLPSWA